MTLTPKQLNDALWVVQMGLSIFYVKIAMVEKLGAGRAWVEYDWPGCKAWHIWVLGVFEVVGACALVIPPTAGIAATLLGAEAAAVAGYHWRIGRRWRSAAVWALVPLLLFVAWGRLPLAT